MRCAEEPLRIRMRSGPSGQVCGESSRDSRAISATTATADAVKSEMCSGSSEQARVRGRSVRRRRPPTPRSRHERRLDRDPKLGRTAVLRCGSLFRCGPLFRRSRGSTPAGIPPVALEVELPRGMELHPFPLEQRPLQTERNIPDPVRRAAARGIDDALPGEPLRRAVKRPPHRSRRHARDHQVRDLSVRHDTPARNLADPVVDLIPHRRTCAANVGVHALGRAQAHAGSGSDRHAGIL